MITFHTDNEFVKVDFTAHQVISINQLSASLNDKDNENTTIRINTNISLKLEDGELISPYPCRVESLIPGVNAALQFLPTYIKGATYFNVCLILTYIAPESTDILPEYATKFEELPDGKKEMVAYGAKNIIINVGKAIATIEIPIPKLYKMEIYGGAYSKKYEFGRQLHTNQSRVDP